MNDRSLPSTLPLEAEYRSVDDVVEGLAHLEAALRARRDRRAIFATAYLTITRELRLGVAGGVFVDDAWVARYAVAFGNLYREALAAFERGDLPAVPKAWRISFEISASGTALVLQDLVLGINAHVNYDLALALASVSIDPDRADRYRDHTAVNQTLRTATDLLQDRIGELYAPILRLLDRAGGRLDEELAGFSVSKAREHAWVTAVALANAQDDEERLAIRRALDDHAAVIARLVASADPRYPWLFGALRHLESISPWWECITPSEIERRRAERANEAAERPG